jgi:hypothetical protein
MDQKRKVILYNFESKEVTSLFAGYTYQALQSSDNKTFIVDHIGKLKQVINGVAHQLPRFEEQFVKTIFLGKDQTLFVEGRKGALWQYDWIKQNKSMLLPPLEDAKRITDIDIENNRLLFMRLISTKREIVVFH